MAVLDIDEVIAQLAGDFRRRDIVIDQSIDIGIFDQRIVGRESEFAIEDRVAVEYGRLHPVFAEGPAKPTRVGELQPQ